MKCPICAKELTGRPGESKPFCSSRCRQVDLGKWLNEEYRVPTDEGADSPEGDT